jgi:hypothetical protein
LTVTATLWAMIAQTARSIRLSATICQTGQRRLVEVPLGNVRESCR